MKIRIEGARENNLKNINVDFSDGLTVVTGVSGSGKTSLVFDTLYHEAKRRLQEVFDFGSPNQRLSPADVDSVTGLGPTVAVEQNLLNRNPNSTLATASGLHPFLRLLYARFGTRMCGQCGEKLNVLSVDEIVSEISRRNRRSTIKAHLVFHAVSSHTALLELLTREYGVEALEVDGRKYADEKLDPGEPHSIILKLSEVQLGASHIEIKEHIATAAALGCTNIIIDENGEETRYSTAPVCPSCGTWYQPLRPHSFNQKCPYCEGKGCPRCNQTGLDPEAANVTWMGYGFNQLQTLDVDTAHNLFNRARLPEGANRLQDEIMKRLDALKQVGLGYIQLNRPSPTLSRGESQRVRLAVALTSSLEDVVHVLDEPTIGQHPSDVQRLVPAFRDLKGPVIYVEHDRVAAALADHVVDVGPGAGTRGGEIVFTGSPSQLWNADTATGRYFSLREKVKPKKHRPEPSGYIEIVGAFQHNLKDINVKIPLKRLTVVTGVSGSGKSTLIEDVLVESLNRHEQVGCHEVKGWLSPVMVDQSPIGRNPRSTPATYTKLSDIIRDHYAEGTGLNASHFSFNRPEGACPTCGGMGAIEVKMRYLPSTWITCSDCEGRRYSDEVIAEKLNFNGERLSVADFYDLNIEEAYTLIGQTRMDRKRQRDALSILKALKDIGLGYLTLGQPSPTLSGGEAQRVKLAKYLGRGRRTDKLILLDEPSTGLHPLDIMGLVAVLDDLVDRGATVVVVEHNTDIVRASDWVIDLGPGAGPSGGELVYMGSTEGLLDSADSLTANALREESRIQPTETPRKGFSQSQSITVRGARVHNLKSIDASFPKGKITVVTGVSGCGKSSLVTDTLEAEAKRRYLETLSMYERQGVKEGPEAPVDEVSGLGVTITITPERKLYSRRSTVGTVTEIEHHLAALYSTLGTRNCTTCGSEMTRGQQWTCPSCGATAPIASPLRFNPSTYSAACTTCHGVGTLQKPNPSKLITDPTKPLCRRAMHSPGFFPQGYLCKPGNHGHDVVHAFAERHGFSPEETPWKTVPRDVQEMFYYGDKEPLEVTFNKMKGRTYTSVVEFKGFYGWVRDWDIGGTYTDTILCPDCKGARLRPEYLAIKLMGYNIYQLETVPLSKLTKVIDSLPVPDGHIAEHSYKTIQRRLRFLIQVGLDYINLNRISATLSAGEAQRIKLAGLLGSGLTSLTVLLDEPTRGLHPREVNALYDALAELRDEGNTVIVVEHDLEIIRRADHIIEMGPGPGAEGGMIVAEGSLAEIIDAGTVTGKWLRLHHQASTRKRRAPSGWMTINGARENNLKAENIRIPLGVLTGVCGVSGSGKSTLIIDTLARALNPIKHTTSVAREPLDPGAHDDILNPPRDTVTVDQTRRGIRSPARYLGLDKQLAKIYSETDEAAIRGLNLAAITTRCSVCDGAGYIRTDMEFLPDIYTECETCRGTGYSQEAWEIKYNGYNLPELNNLTLEQVYNLFKDQPDVAETLNAAIEVGLGYLVLHQPAHTLSGGEAQRLKIAAELTKKNGTGTLYILDEPSLGQHLEDVERLTGVLHRLVEEENTVIIVEHHPDMLAACDWLIELGPVGGPEGGYIIAEGTPETIGDLKTPSAPYIKAALEATP